MGEPGQGQTKQLQDNSGFQKKRSALFKNIYLYVYIYMHIYLLSL